MSFFRNIRNIARGNKSTSRDTTPVNNSGQNSRPNSVISNNNNNNITNRRDSFESGHDSNFNRSDTFVLDSEQDDKALTSSNSNTSTLEKKSKKSKVLSKFSTFTKRKKTPSPDITALEHHPSENATNTYYNWKTETNLDDYDADADPFNFLYEKPSSLKAMKNGISDGNNNNHSQSNGIGNANDILRRSNSNNSNNSHVALSGVANIAFDSSTYRKSKMPTQLKEQLEQLKTTQTQNPQNHLHEEAFEMPEENEEDKYKTITLSTFRKSFRDKFLQQQKAAPYNPSWFVEVEPPASTATTEKTTTKTITKQRDTKENRPDYFVYENENYRPESRSPVRDPTILLSSSNNHNNNNNNNNNSIRNRNATHSPVKRNETFRLERSNLEKYTNSPVLQKHKLVSEPSIRVEIKNSITPHMPSRILPVGVAKPMLSQLQQQQQQNTKSIIPATDPVKPIMSRINAIKSPLSNWSKPITVIPSRFMGAQHKNQITTTATQLFGNETGGVVSTTPIGRYQTLVQIRNDATVAPSAGKSTQMMTSATTTTTTTTTTTNKGNQQNRHMTRIQLSGNSNASPSMSMQKRYNSAGSRYSIANPFATSSSSNSTVNFRNYDILKNPTTALAQRPSTSMAIKSKATTYFGDNYQQPTTTTTTTATAMRTQTTGGLYARGNNNMSNIRLYDNLTNSYNNTTNTTAIGNKQRTTAATNIGGVGGDGVGGGGIRNLYGRRDQPRATTMLYQQQPQRILVPTQRRSRSPIKLPWR